MPQQVGYPTPQYINPANTVNPGYLMPQPVGYPTPQYINPANTVNPGYSIPQPVNGAYLQQIRYQPPQPTNYETQSSNINYQHKQQ